MFSLLALGCVYIWDFLIGPRRYLAWAFHYLLEMASFSSGMHRPGTNMVGVGCTCPFGQSDATDPIAEGNPNAAYTVVGLLFSVLSAVFPV